MVKKVLTAAAMAAVLGVSASAWGQAKDDNKNVLLEQFSSWRGHHQLRPPVYQTATGLKPMLLAMAWLNAESPAAPTDWMKPDFDDGGWFRGSIPWMIHSPWLARLSLRGRFQVIDPAAVQGLELSLEYHGGVIVYVNGQEAFRRNMPEGPVGEGTVAEAYPKEAFSTETGEPLFPAGLEMVPPKGVNWDIHKTSQPSAESARRMGLWSRKAESVAIPAKLLRKGVNVIAIEVVRSAYDAVIEEIKNSYRQPYRDVLGYQIYFCTCQIDRVQLKAGSLAGLVSNSVRPAGFQVWSCSPAEPILDMEFGDPCEGIHPISLVAPRGGTYSGKVGVGNNKPIRGLRGAITDLTGPGGAIPASRVSVRYGFEWGREDIAEGMCHAPWPYPRLTNLIGGVGDTAQEEYPVRDPRGTRRGDGGPEPVNGAVSAVWVTVHVPTDAKPGAYKGTLTVEADGQKPVPVPVEIKVVDWELPPAKDFVSLVDTVECPDTLALEYKVEPWSERHWEMIGRAMDFQGQVGTWTLYLPLICHTNLGNEESMVRWVKKPGGPLDKLGTSDGNGPTGLAAGGQYDYDFSILDRYLDTAEKHRGKPRITILDVWDLYMIENGGKLPPGETYTDERRIRDPRMAENVLAVGGKIDLGPLVTEYDPATKKTKTLELPHLGEPVSKGLWEPMLKQLQERLRKRGIDKTVMFGLHTDAWARKATVKFFNDILPGTPWVVQSHDGYSGKLMHDLVTIGFQTRVWGTKFGDNNLVGRQGMEVKAAPGVEVDGRLYGWRRPELVGTYERTVYFSVFPAVRWRYYVETQTTGNQSGVGRLGADIWPVLKNKNGDRQYFAWNRYPESDWRNLCLTNYLLAPGPKGPGTTTRFESFREGLQEAEARIFIEKALLDPAKSAKLGPELVKKCRDLLDARLAMMYRSMSNLQMIGGGNDAGTQYATGWRWAGGPFGQVWFIGSGWQQRSEDLYALAGEVARKQ